ncbi:MAG: transcription elongation factor GreA [Minisyncoccia bacterium]|jgi:transcription elongation factor GreA
MITYLTPEKYQQLKEELDYLKKEKRRELSNKIQEAKELGDLSENAMYQEARNEQMAVETRILEIENLLKTVSIIKTKTNSNRVEIGSRIKVESLTPPKIKKEFLIIGAQEANPLEGKISNESPLGKAFLGHKKGDVIIVKTPKGEVKYKILEIS